MKCRIVKIDELTGNDASVYGVELVEEGITLFDRFLGENKESFISELSYIAMRLTTIGFKSGARAGFFKLHEGKEGDYVCALYDKPDSKLRLYCIRFGTDLIVLGGVATNQNTYEPCKRLRNLDLRTTC